MMKILPVLIIVALFLGGCVQDQNDKTQVIVSILPQKEFVEKVGGDLIEVNELIPPGASPATYNPTTQDLIKVEKADIYFKIGELPFEKANEERIQNLNPDLIVVSASSIAELREFEEHEEHEHHEHEGEHEEHGHDEHDHSHEGIDPHIWLSPQIMIKHVEQIRDTLKETDPQNAQIYEENAQDYLAELRELDNELKDKLSNLRTKKMMVFHPAWGYFADAYGLEQIAIEQEGKEPTSEELAELIEHAKEENIRVIFVQQQFSTQTAESVAEEINGAVVKIDPLGKNYVENMRGIAQTLQQKLG